jgi:hypothetical protein
MVAFQSPNISFSVIVVDVAGPVSMCLDMVFSPGFFFSVAEKSVFLCAPTSFCPIGWLIAPLERARLAGSSREIPVPIGPAVGFLCCYMLYHSLVLVGCAFGGALAYGGVRGGVRFRGGSAPRRSASEPARPGGSFPQPTIFRAPACATTRRRTGARRPAFERARRADQGACPIAKFRWVFASACRCWVRAAKSFGGVGGDKSTSTSRRPAKAR